MSSVHDEITALEEQLRLAELAPDAAFFEDHLDNDAIMDFERAKGMVVAAHRPGGSATFTSVTMQDIEIIPQGDNAAVVTCRGTYAGGMGVFSLRFMRVWVRKNGRWKIVAGTVAR